MRQATVFLAVLMFLSVSMTGCLRDGRGSQNQGGAEVSGVYEAGPYEVLVYEDIVFASGLAHTSTRYQ